MAVPGWAYTGALCAGAPRAGWLAGDVFKASTKSLRYPRSIIKINLYTQLSVPWERGDGVWMVGRGYCYKPISFFFFLSSSSCQYTELHPIFLLPSLYPEINQTL